MRTPAGRWILAAISALLVAGCSGLGRLPAPYTVHDLGLPGKPGAPLALPTRAIQVRSPSWLGSSAMQYRARDANNPTRRAYVNNRWAAAPAELVEIALQRALPASNPDGGGCVLFVDLDEFSQIFPSAGESYGLIEARLRLSSPRNDAVFAVRPVSISVPATTPDARGGAVALGAATRELAVRIAEWVNALDQGMPGGANGSGRCR